MFYFYCFFFQAEDGIRDLYVTGVQTCALPISAARRARGPGRRRRPPAADGPPSRHRELGVETEPTVRAGPVGQRPTQHRHPLRHAQERSEERRVGKECRSWWWPYQYTKRNERR